jgi:hypothetical protein
MINRDQLVEILKQYRDDNPGALERDVLSVLAEYLLRGIVSAVGQQGTSPIRLMNSLIAIEDRLRKEDRDASFGCWIAGEEIRAALCLSGGKTISVSGAREPKIIDAIDQLGRKVS